MEFLESISASLRNGVGDWTMLQIHCPCYDGIFVYISGVFTVGDGFSILIPNKGINLYNVRQSTFRCAGDNYVDL